MCWGTRGSVPSPGSRTVRYGGNTSCLEVRAGGRRLIFDAGTGIIGLGHRLASDASLETIDLFLTHFHWDHIQGLPFFAPLRDPARTIRIHARPQGGATVEALLAVQMTRPFFPVALQEMPARIEYHDLDRSWVDRELAVAAFPVRHPDHTCGLRLTVDGATIVYIPDNEPEYEQHARAVSLEAIVDSAGAADLLLHGAMFTTAEYESRRGWGHGTVDQAIRLARAADARRLLLVHHHPDRTDEQIDAIVEVTRAESCESGRPLEVAAAAEGREILVGTFKAQP